MKRRDERLATAVERILGLTLVGDIDLGMLVGVDEPDARGLRATLTCNGWTEVVTPRGDGLQARPLALIREEALPPLAERLGMTVAELTSRWPVGRAAIHERIARHAVVQGVNRTLALLASQLRASGDGALEAARSLPLSVPPEARWWPPLIEAEFSVRVDDELGSGFLAWDRAGAPDIHRRDRVRRWFKSAVEALDQQPVAPILVVSAGDRETRVWTEAVRRWQEHTGRAAVDVLIAPAAEVLRVGPLHAAWRVPGARDGCSLMHWLDWQAAVPPARSTVPFPQVPHRAPTLRAQLGRFPLRAGAPRRERVASLSLALDPLGRALIEWLARHPWLFSTQLAVALNDPEPAVRRRLEILARYGLARSVRAPEVDADLWIARELGLHLLAAADGVPASRYREAGALTVPIDADERPGEVVLPRAFAHELGVNRAFVALAKTARRDGGRLALWRNEAESLHIFGVGSAHRVRPDGSGVLELGGQALPFLLEYERGTLSRAQLRTKVLAYERYYQAAAWEEYFDREPVVLWVCADYRAARRVAAEAGVPSTVLPTVIVREPDSDDRVVDWLHPLAPGRDGVRDKYEVAGAKP